MSSAPHPHDGSPSPRQDGSLIEQTLAHFQAHRAAWSQNPALRTLYQRWYGKVRDALPAQELGPWVEIGSGPGFAREFIPGMQLTDVVKAPWHDQQVDAEDLPFAPGSLGALVLFDVLHHLPRPGHFFAQAERVLRPGGRLIVCEPYVSPVSYPVYRFLHPEGLDMAVDPFGDETAVSPGKDPFAGNQAIPTLLFARRAAELSRRFPRLRQGRLERLSGLAYPASGGFSRTPLLPMLLWRALLSGEDRLPELAFRLFGFRLFVVLDRV